MEQRRRIPIFDQIKGLCMILVVLAHGLYYISNMTKSDQGGYWILCNIITLFHMPLMFCVSGYLQSMRKRSTFAADFKKDLLSLYVPYLFLVYGLLAERTAGKALFGIEGETSVSLTKYGMIKYLFVPDGTAWFLLSLMLVKTVVRLMDKWMKVQMMLLLSVIIVLAVWLRWPEQVVIVRYMPAYIAGYSMHELRVSKCRELTIISAVAVSVFAVYALVLPAGILVKNIAGIAFFYLFLMYPKLLPVGDKVIRCGRESMVLYMIHVLTEWPLLIITNHFISNELLLLAAYLAESFGLFAVVYYLYTKTWAFSWMEYLFYPYRAYIKICSRHNGKAEETR